MPAVKSRHPQRARCLFRNQHDAKRPCAPARDPISVLIVVPTLEVGAADVGAVGLARILTAAGHRAIVVSHAGRLVADVTAAGGRIHPARVAGNNPIAMLRNAVALIAHRARAPMRRDPRARPLGGLERSHRRAARGIPFVTSWYKGFREQNMFKRLYNGVMARGDRVVAVSEQIAQLINDRYGTPWERIAVVPGSIDFERFDPARCRARARRGAAAWPGASSATPK